MTEPDRETPHILVLDSDPGFERRSISWLTMMKEHAEVCEWWRTSLPVSVSDAPRKIQQNNYGRGHDHDDG